MIRPLLAATIDPKKEPGVFSKLRFPLMLSPKLDGIRGLCYNYGVYSREGILLPSEQVQGLFSQYDGYDSEIVVGEPNTMNVYNRTQSSVMSKGKPADVTMYVIDRIGMPGTFRQRYNQLQKEFEVERERVKLIPQYIAGNLEEFFQIETDFLEQGFEGVMARNPESPYLYKRSTMNEHALMKLKRFTDVEVVVIGFVEQMRNTNTATLDALGYTKRSAAKEGMVPAGTLGKFVVDFGGIALEIGCGAFTHKERQFIWDHQSMFTRKILKMRYFGVGQDGYLPRFGRAVGWRNFGE